MIGTSRSGSAPPSTASRLAAARVDAGLSRGVFSRLDI